MKLQTLQRTRNALASPIEQLHILQDRRPSHVAPFSDRLTEPTSQLLQLSRAESSPSPTETVPFPLNKLLLDVVDSLQPLAAKSQVTVMLSEPSCDCSIRGDRDAMRQVFHNLIDNAIKYNVTNLGAMSPN